MTFTAPYSFMGRGRGEGGAELFSPVSEGRMSGNGLKLHQGRIRLDIRKHSLTERLGKHWSRLPGQAVDALSLVVLKAFGL